jgi:hypothetical protein
MITRAIRAWDIGWFTGSLRFGMGTNPFGILASIAKKLKLDHASLTESVRHCVSKAAYAKLRVSTPRSA